MKIFLASILFIASVAQACELPPSGFDFKEVRIRLKIQMYNYDYFIHLEFPDLKKLCWEKSTDGTFNAHTDRPEQIKIRGSTLDESDSYVMDTLDVDSFSIGPQGPGLMGFSTAPSRKYQTSFWVFYSGNKNLYFFGSQNLYTPIASTKITGYEVIK